MTCNEAQSLITPFINDELDILKLEEFINHINHCGECKEELEVYYTLLTGMKQLDDDKNLSGNFHIDFVNKLKKTEDRIKRKKIQRVRKKVILVFTIVIFSIITSISIKQYVEEDYENENNTLKQPNAVHLKYYYFRGKKTPLEIYMKEHYQEWYQYKKKLKEYPSSGNIPMNHLLTENTPINNISINDIPINEITINQLARNELLYSHLPFLKILNID